jgi:HD-like signal output (HDOD) protein
MEPTPSLIDLDEVLAQTTAFPAMPQSATRLSALFAVEGWELEQVTETVKLDPVLTARVLRAANSVASGSVCQISSVDLATMRVGPGAILALAMGSVARDPLSVELPCYGLSSGQLWQRSVAGALAVERSQRYLGSAPPPEAFAAALLRDFGVLALAGQLSPEVLDLLHRSQTEGGQSPVRSELEILGVHHGEVGGLVARNWELPEVIAEGIAFHHEPWEAPTDEGREVAYLVAVADHVALLATGDPTGSESSKVLMEHFELTEARIEEFVEDVRARLDDVLSRYA